MPEPIANRFTTGVDRMHIITRSLVVASMVAVVTFSSPAANASVSSPIHAMFANAKAVQISLRNDSSVPMELRAGDQVMKIEAGKSMTVKLPAGTRIVTNTDTGKHKAGDLIVEVSTSLSGATIAIS